MPVVFDKINHQYTLESKLGGGGEGDVFEIGGDLQSKFVAKIYKEVLTAEKKDKLAAMVESFDDKLSEVSAWPKELLFDKNRNLVGFLMPRITGYRPIHELFNPSSRKRNFPESDFSFLIHTARNIVAAFGNIHSKGFIIGDVNEGNILVSTNAVVKLIDCDSFQITKNDKTYRCEVGIPMYTPPELQSSKSFRDALRTTNHDIFGMAVMCFQILFMGRHPFVGLYKGPDTPLEKAIEKFWFTYGDNAEFKGLSPPGEALNFNSIPEGLQRLFNQSFLEAGTISRPGINQWLEEIGYLKKNLRVCAKEPKHKFFTGVNSCPWCEFENKRGVFFFISSKVGAFTLQGFDLNEIWNRIRSINLPQEESINLDKINVTPNRLPPSVSWSKIYLFLQKTLALVIPLILTTINSSYILLWIPIGFVIWKIPLFGKELERITEERRNSLTYARAKWDEINREWDSEIANSKFDSTLKEITVDKEKYERLSEDYNREKRILHSQLKELQLERFLDNYFIRYHQIPKIGDNRKQALASFGINTASDIKKLNKIKIPGFGDFLEGHLFQWRKNLEGKFRFDPSRGLDPEDINKLDRRFEAIKNQLQNSLKSAPETLEAIRHQTIRRRIQLKSRMTELGTIFKQAQTDYSLL